MPVYLKYLRWVIAALTLITFIVPAVGCVMLYAEGNESVFTREAAVTVLKPFWYLAAADAILIIAAGILGRRYPEKEKIWRMTAADRARFMKKRGCETMSDSERKTGIGSVRILICAAAALLIVLGIFNGGARDVLVKAINICTECIGLG